MIHKTSFLKKFSWKLKASCYSRPNKKGANMAKKKRIVRRAWTKDDLRTLKSMAKDKQGVKKIAKALKRTPGATSVMAVKRGISLSMRA
jgi:hypothetical protein